MIDEPLFQQSISQLMKENAHFVRKQYRVSL